MDKEKEQTQLTLDTREFGASYEKASAIPETGIEIVFKSVETKATKFGEAFVLHCENENGKLDIIFSSKKLGMMLMQNQDKLKDKKIIIQGQGHGVNRQYKVLVKK